MGQLLVVLIGLGPLLTASHDFTEGLAFGMASLVVLCLSNLYAATLGRLLPQRGRAAALLVLIGALVTAIDLLFQAHWQPPDRNLALFMPLILTNCLILERAEHWAAHPAAHPAIWSAVSRALLDGLRHGVIFVLLLAGFGALRAALAPSLGIAVAPAGLLFLLAGLLALHQLATRRINTNRYST